MIILNYRNIFCYSTKAINLAASINRWTTYTSRDAIWERAVTDIITADSHTVRDLQSLQTPRDHINPSTCN